MKKTLIVIIVVLVVLIVGMATWFKFYSQPVQAPVACTMDAKICPDGSSVGRIAPDCQFAACPVITGIEGWKTFADPKQNLQFMYPAKLGTSYIVNQEWPPAVSVSSTGFSCAVKSNVNGQATVVQKVIGQNNYCISSTSEGAAGTIYVTYDYATTKNGKLVDLKFTLGYPQCLNYDDPNQTSCLNEQKALDLDGVVNKMVATLQF